MGRLSCIILIFFALLIYVQYINLNRLLFFLLIAEAAGAYYNLRIVGTSLLKLEGAITCCSFLLS